MKVKLYAGVSALNQSLMEMFCFYLNTQMFKYIEASCRDNNTTWLLYWLQLVYRRVHLKSVSCLFKPASTAISTNWFCLLMCQILVKLSLEAFWVPLVVWVLFTTHVCSLHSGKQFMWRFKKGLYWPELHKISVIYKLRIVTEMENLVPDVWRPWKICLFPQRLDPQRLADGFPHCRKTNELYLSMSTQSLWWDSGDRHSLYF